MKTVDVETVFEKVRISLENLLNSDRLTWLTDRAMPQKYEWLIEPPVMGKPVSAA
jgi:hypothetical protein